MDGADFDVRRSLDASYEADAACRHALDHGAGAKLYEGVVPVEELLVIYRRRIEHLKRLGVETIGSDKVIERMSQARGLIADSVGGLRGDSFRRLR